MANPAGENLSLQGGANHLFTVLPEIRLMKFMEKLHCDFPSMASDMVWQLNAGEKQSLKEWENHLSTICPEIRLKKFIEKLHLNHPHKPFNMLWQSLQERSRP